MQNDNMIEANIFCSHHNIEVSFITSLQEHGLLHVDMIEEKYFIPEEELPHLEKMVRLHYDLDINPEGLEVVDHLVHRIEEMQEEIEWLKCKLKVFGTPL
jgi:hypothetical protein